MTRDRERNKPECRICVRDCDGEDGLCSHCRSASRVNVAIDALVEFLEAKQENEKL